jgi:hypothetical protein
MMDQPRFLDQAVPISTLESFQYMTNHVNL